MPSRKGKKKCQAEKKSRKKSPDWKSAKLHPLEAGEKYADQRLSASWGSD